MIRSEIIGQFLYISSLNQVPVVSTTTTVLPVIYASASKNDTAITSNTASRITVNTDGSNKLLMMMADFWPSGSVTSVLVNNSATGVTKIGNTIQWAEAGAGGYVYYLLNPASGSNVVQFNYDHTITETNIGAISFTGVNQTTPIGSSGSLGYANLGTQSIALSNTNTTDMVIGYMTAYNVSPPVFGLNPGQTKLWDTLSGASEHEMYVLYQTGSATSSTASLNNRQGFGYFACVVKPV